MAEEPSEHVLTDKHHESVFNVQFVADTNGRLVDVCEPVPGERGRLETEAPSTVTMGGTTWRETAGI